MSLAALYFALDIDPLEGQRPKPPSFDSVPLRTPDVDPFEALKPNPLSNHLLIQNYGRRAEKSAPAAPSFGFDSDCIGDAPRAPEARLEKRAPSNIRYEKKANGVTFAYDERNEIVGVWAAGVEPNLERP